MGSPTDCLNFPSLSVLAVTSSSFDELFFCLEASRRGHPALLQTLCLDLQLFSFKGLPQSVSGVVLGTRFGILLSTSLFACCGLVSL